MNYVDQQQFIMQQGQRMQNPRMMSVPTTVTPQHMHRQQRYGMGMMQPGQQPVQIASGQYVQNPQMQPRLLTMSDALSRLPPEVQQMAQQQINAETNAEKKRQIALGFIQGRVRLTQQYPGQGAMNAGGMMISVGLNQQVGMSQGNTQMVRMGAVQSGPVPYPTQNVSLQTGMGQMGPTQVTVQRMPNHYMTAGMNGPQGMQYQSQDAGNVQNYNSPQQITLTQPSSVGPAVQQTSSLHHKGPSSVPSAIYTQHHPGESAAPAHSISGGEGDKCSDEPLYSQKLELLKPYHEHIKRLLERNRYDFDVHVDLEVRFACSLDGQAPKSKFERLLEIMENRRKVELKLLEKLVVSVRNLIERDSLCFPLIDALRLESADATKTPLPDPWGDFHQYAIKIPEKVLSLVKDEKSKSKEGKDSVPMKRIKKEENCDDRIVVVCQDGSRLELSQEASDQLRPYNYRFDPEFIPISDDCTEIQVFIENDILLVPPLRLVVPLNYPETRASIWRDRWSYGGVNLVDINTQFDKRLNMAVNCRTITEIISAWKLASLHVLKIGSSSANL
uniref:Mediator complex subunit 15 KIX domain-containing protein n=1 Tax=Setaria digitata TaxID=48799 RepID=A0A915Q4H1_9BILA